MDKIIADLLMNLIIWGLIVFLSFIAWNFLSKGFLRKFIVVKASKGKKILVKAKTITGKFFIVGKVKETEYIWYKGVDKLNKMFYIRPGCIYQEMGISCCDVDEVKGGVWDYQENSIIITRNPEDKSDQIIISVPVFVEQPGQNQLDDFYTRVSMRPLLNKATIMEIIMIVGIIMAIGLIAMVYYKQTKDHQIVVNMFQTLYNETIKLQPVVIKNIPAGANVI